jgi:hypothetical protein
MSFKIGDIYDIPFIYDDDSSRYKRRPALIFDIKPDGLVLKLLKMTSKNHGKYYDQFKVQVQFLREAGLSKPSWVQTYGALLVTREEFLSLYKEYRGQLDARDLNVVQNRYQ